MELTSKMKKNCFPFDSKSKEIIEKWNRTSDNGYEFEFSFGKFKFFHTQEEGGLQFWNSNGEWEISELPARQRIEVADTLSVLRSYLTY